MTCALCTMFTAYAYVCALLTTLSTLYEVENHNNRYLSTLPLTCIHLPLVGTGTSMVTFIASNSPEKMSMRTIACWIN